MIIKPVIEQDIPLRARRYEDIREYLVLLAVDITIIMVERIGKHAVVGDVIDHLRGIP
jgi:hypothetical protein